MVQNEALACAASTVRGERPCRQEIGSRAPLKELLEAMKGLDNRKDIDWIRTILPHRYPFLLVDRVLELEAGKRIVAVKNVTVNEEFFLGHFPQRPVMPGVLIIEALAQAAGILLLHDRQERDSYLVYLTAIERARFRRPVVPGDQLRLEVEIAQLRRDYSKVDTRAVVDGEVAAEVVLSSAMVKR